MSTPNVALHLTDICDSQQAAAKAIAIARGLVSDLFEAKTTDDKVDAYAHAMLELQHVETAIEGIGCSVQDAGGAPSEHTAE